MGEAKRRRQAVQRSPEDIKSDIAMAIGRVVLPSVGTCWFRNAIAPYQRLPFAFAVVVALSWASAEAGQSKASETHALAARCLKIGADLLDDAVTSAAIVADAVMNKCWDEIHKSFGATLGESALDDATLTEILHNDAKLSRLQREFDANVRASLTTQILDNRAKRRYGIHN